MTEQPDQTSAPPQSDQSTPKPADSTGKGGASWEDKILAPIAFLLFAGFLAFPIYFIDAVDLWIVIIVVVIMAGVDFYQALRSNGKPSKG